MSKSNTTENGFAKLVFNNIAMHRRLDGTIKYI